MRRSARDSQRSCRATCRDRSWSSGLRRRPCASGRRFTASGGRSPGATISPSSTRPASTSIIRCFAASKSRTAMRPAHLIYRPAVRGFAEPKSLVLVDDEVSTGTTLANLAARPGRLLAGRGTHCDRIADGLVRRSLGPAPPVPRRRCNAADRCARMDRPRPARSLRRGAACSRCIRGDPRQSQSRAPWLRMPQMDLPQRLPDLPSWRSPAHHRHGGVHLSAFPPRRTARARRLRRGRAVY
jgi:hypothetical protein